MRSKFEGIIRKIAEFMVNGETEKAKRHFNRAWKHYDEMTEIEQEVMNSHRYNLYGRPFENIVSEAACYWEGRILARQDMSEC